MANSPVPNTVPTPTSLLVRNVANILTNISGDEEAAAMKVTAEMSGLHSNPKNKILFKCSRNSLKLYKNVE